MIHPWKSTANRQCSLTPWLHYGAFVGRREIALISLHPESRRKAERIVGGIFTIHELRPTQYSYKPYATQRGYPRVYIRRLILLASRVGQQLPFPAI